MKIRKPLRSPASYSLCSESGFDIRPGRVAAGPSVPAHSVCSSGADALGDGIYFPWVSVPHPDRLVVVYWPAEKAK